MVFSLTFALSRQNRCITAENHAGHRVLASVLTVRSKGCQHCFENRKPFVERVAQSWLAVPELSGRNPLGTQSQAARSSVRAANVVTQKAWRNGSKLIGQRNYRSGFRLMLQPHMLEVPLRWKKPQAKFVNSTSDLFHENAPVSYVRVTMPHLLLRSCLGAKRSRSIVCV